MSYSDDTAEFMFSGRPTMTELGTPDGAENLAFVEVQPRRGMCESCHMRPIASQITYGDGAQFMLCVDCRPFDPTQVHIIDVADKEQ